ncbi:MAG: asparagine synthase-related protein [Actinomycetota bacterium]
MSGIAGILKGENKNPEKNKVELMLDKISHRGINEGNIMEIDGNSLGIISNYPTAGSGVLLDGKIYNIDRLMLKYRVGKPEGATDSQKVSLLVKEAGPGVIKEFEGAFSLMVCDSSNNFYLARDLIGIKPLYYVKDGGRVIFASEIKSLVEFGNRIIEFPPGHIMKNLGTPSKHDSIGLDSYSFLNDAETEEMVSMLEKKLLDAVEKRITGNGKSIGVWLSGGVDSSLVAALVNKFTDSLYTFSVGFAGSPDLEASRVVAKALKTRHIEHKLNLEELYDAIPEVIYHLESFDAPLVRSSLGNMIASRLSSRADIVFSGEGGDEVFAGYNYFFDFDSSEVIQKELLKAINSLHNTALQRVDRLANANNVVVRLPMLDENLIDFAMTIPTEEKIKKAENISKYILRKVAEKYLPKEIAWRAKEKFWEGSGILDTLTEKIEDNIDDSEFEKNRKLDNGFVLRNKEEMYFYNIFRKFFGDLDINSVLSFTGDFS